MLKYLLFLIVVIFPIACSRYPDDVEQALKLAGDNRTELEKVLEHYNERPEDKLKLQSAYYLIANMPYHFTICNERLDSFKIYLGERKPKERSWSIFNKSFGQKMSDIIEPDLYHITSEFLIRNIDFSFHIWKHVPWSKYYSFDDFCEDILPYRLSHEPLEYWKEKYYAVFRPMIDTLGYQDHPYESCLTLLKYIKEQGWNLDNDFQSHGFGASILLEQRYGNCQEVAEFLTYVFRSLGIPSGINLIIQHPDKMTQSHFWNYIRNINRKLISIDYYYDYHTIDAKRYVRKYGKVYRQSFAIQKESFPIKFKNKHIPYKGLNNTFLQDISSDYFPDTHISFHSMPNGFIKKNDLVYLCVFNNREWIPITWSIPKSDMVKFEHVEHGILYQLRLIDETRNVAVSKPFILLGNENAQYLDADMTDLQSMTLFRKYRFAQTTIPWAIRSVNGKFQGANKPDFSDSVTLHTIQKPADMSYVNVKPGHPGKFRYVRYLSAENGFNNMAEAKFYANGIQLYGTVIGSDGAKDIFPNSDKNSVFDDDPLTFFDAIEADGAWSGLEFDKAYHIDVIRYIFRNDDNNIRPGDTYELLYQSEGEWISTGRQIADTTILQYAKVPSNTLYWLRNHTRGKEERPFTYENGQQVWW